MKKPIKEIEVAYTEVKGKNILITKLETRVVLVFKNSEDSYLELETTFKDLLERTLDDFYEDLEPECTSSGCNNESQNFCDCGAVNEDYTIYNVKILTSNQ